MPFLGTEMTQGPVRHGTAHGALVLIGLPAVPALAEALHSGDEAVRGDAAIKLASIHREVGLNDRDLQDAVIAELRLIQDNHPESLSNISIPGLITELER